MEVHFDHLAAEDRLNLENARRSREHARAQLLKWFAICAHTPKDRIDIQEDAAGAVIGIRRKG